MKKFLTVFLLITLFGCNTENIPGDVITSEFIRINNVLTKDQWIVGNFTVDHEIQTNLFEDLVFTFDSDGTVTVVNEDYNHSGNWEYISRPYIGEMLQLDLDNALPLSRISSNWKIVSLINTKVELNRENSDSDTNDVLILERIQD